MEAKMSVTEERLETETETMLRDIREGRFPKRSAPAMVSDKSCPRVIGAGRMFDNERAILIILDRKPSDEDIRAFGGGLNVAAPNWSLSEDQYDGVRDLIMRAYEQGCKDVHANHQEDSDPDFTEAAYDYTASVSDDFMKLFPSANSPSQTVKLMGALCKAIAMGEESGAGNYMLKLPFETLVDMQACADAFRDVWACRRANFAES